MKTKKEASTTMSNALSHSTNLGSNIYRFSSTYFQVSRVDDVIRKLVFKKDFNVPKTHSFYTCASDYLSNNSVMSMYVLLIEF